MRLATEVNWTDEEECFRTFCEETAKFYAVHPNIPNARLGYAVRIGSVGDGTTKIWPYKRYGLTTGLLWTWRAAAQL